MNTQISLKQELIEQQQWLFQEFNFKITEATYDPSVFGDSLVTLVSSSLRVQFSRDRGQVFAMIASPLDPENWWPLDDVCEFILHKKIRRKFDLHSVVILLKNNLPALIKYLGPKLDETRRELQKKFK